MQDFREYLRIDERLSYKQAKDYKNVARRLLRLSKGLVSRQAVRDYMKSYLKKAPKTYNNNLDGLRAFVERYLGRSDLIAGFKHTHVPNNYEEELPEKTELQKGFEALTTDQEKAIYLFYATSGLRRSEALALKKDDIDRKTRCVKSKHDTRTKKAGVTFYNTECKEYLNKIWNCNGDEVFNFKVREFKALWRKASKKAGVRIRPQILRKWHATKLGELGVPDRYVDVFQGRAPKTVLAKHYTGKGLERLKRIYDKAGLKVLC